MFLLEEYHDLYKDVVLARNRAKCLHTASDLSGNSWLLEKYRSVPRREAVMCTLDAAPPLVCKHFQPWWHRGFRMLSVINHTLNEHRGTNSIYVTG